MEHENLDSKVHKKLKAMIMSRQLPPGTKIFQDQLATKLGVSRTPLLGALKRLEHEQLIVYMPRRGYSVRVVELAETLQIFELREMLEGLAARHAALKMTPSQIKTCRQFFGRFKATDEINLNEYEQEDQAFHNFLFEINEKELFSKIWRDYNIMTLSYPMEFKAGLIRKPQKTLSEHLAIIEAMVNGNPRMAEKQARKHIKNSKAALENFIKLNPVSNISIESNYEN